MKILAIDQSLTATGYYFCNGNEEKTGVIRPKTKGVTRLLSIRTDIRDLYKRWSPEIIVMEGYSFGSRNTRATFSMGELGGVLKCDAVLNDRPLYIVPPTVWKKYITGKGNLKKEQVLLHVYKKYGITFEDNNKCDAYCLGIFIMNYLRWLEGKNDFAKYQIEVFKKYKKHLSDFHV